MPILPTRSTLRIAIVGAESTGKTTLAIELSRRLEEEFGLRSAAVPEGLRDWCNAHGRTPTRSEQWDIARAQQAAIEAAAATNDAVVADTTPLMTTVYSRHVFNDTSLDDWARAAHATMDCTLLTALDLPWVADGLQRDGPHVREPVDSLIRQRLADWKIAWAVVHGSGPARTESALESLRPALVNLGHAPAAPGGLFASLQAAASGPPRRIAPVCELCDDPACEHRLRRGG